MPSLTHGLTRRALFIWAIVIAGLWLRTVNVGQEPLWSDEALTLLIRHWSSFDLLFRPVDPTAGLYYVLVKLMVPEGASAAAVRSLSVVCGTASIVAIYFVGKLAHSPQAGLRAAGMLAVSPMLADYSQEARAYSLLVLLVLVSAGALLAWQQSLREGRPADKWLALFSVSVILSLYTHFTAIFWIVPALVIGREIGDRLGARRAYTVALSAMAVCAVPEIVRTFTFVRRFGTLGFVPRPDLPDLGRVTVETLSPGGPALLVGLIILCCWRLWRKDVSWNASVTIAVSLLCIPLMVWVFSSLATSIFMPRSILLGIPGLILLVAICDFSRWPLASFSFVAAAGFYLAINGTVRAKEPWGQIARNLQASVEPGDGILVCPGWRAPALLHALREIDNPIFATSESSVSLIEPGANWERASFAALTAWRLQGAPPQAHMTTPERIWIVEYGCSRLPRQWLGAGEYRSLGPGLQLFLGAPRRRPVGVRRPIHD